MVNRQFKKTGISFIVFLLLAGVLPAQSGTELKNLKTFVREANPPVYDTSLEFITDRIGDNLHYLYPLYQLLGSEKKFRERFSDA
ncbi:MAG TPA: hypothetical protein VGM24_03780, partial [Puia sp.]